MEYSIEGAHPLEASFFYEYFENIASSRSAVGKGITGIDLNAVYKSLDMSHRAIDNVKLPFRRVKSPYSDGIIMHGYEFMRVIIEIAQVLAALVRLVRSHLEPLTLSL